MQTLLESGDTPRNSRSAGSLPLVRSRPRLPGDGIGNAGPPTRSTANTERPGTEGGANEVNAEMPRTPTYADGVSGAIIHWADS